MASRNFPCEATGKDFLPVPIAHARTQFAQYEEQRRQLEAGQPFSEFDRTAEHIKQLPAPKVNSTRSDKKNASRKGVGDGE